MIQGTFNTRTFLRALVATLSLAAFAGASPALAAAEAGPRWDILVRSAPTFLPPHGNGKAALIALVINLGDEPVVATEADPVEITDALPAGLVATAQMEGDATRGDNGEPNAVGLKGCKALPVLRCPYVGTLPPYAAIEVEIPVEVEDGVKEGQLAQDRVEVEGGEGSPGCTPPATVTPSGCLLGKPLTVSKEAVPFGVERYQLSPEEEDGAPDLQAGSHPFELTSTVEFNQTFEPDLEIPNPPKQDYPTAPALLRNLRDTLPQGLVANTTLIPQCSEVQFTTILTGSSNDCPPQTAIGVAVVTFKENVYFTQATAAVPVFNLVPAFGEPARLGFEFEKVPVTLDASVLTGDGYAVQVESRDTTQTSSALSAVVTIWGEPGAASHNDARGWNCLDGGNYYKNAYPQRVCKTAKQLGMPPSPFLMLPTSCAQPLSTSVEAQSWKPGASFLPPVESTSSGEHLEGCEKLPFEPSLTVTPEQRATSTPTGLGFEIKLPQASTLTAGELGEADIRDTTVELPEGM